MKFTISGIVEFHREYDCETLEQAVSRFLDEYYGKGMIVMRQVNGMDVLAQCDACKQPIFVGDPYYSDEDEELVCKKCLSPHVFFRNNLN